MLHGSCSRGISSSHILTTTTTDDGEYCCVDHASMHVFLPVFIKTRKKRETLTSWPNTHHTLTLLTDEKYRSSDCDGEFPAAVPFLNCSGSAARCTYIYFCRTHRLLLRFLMVSAAYKHPLSENPSFFIQSYSSSIFNNAHRHLLPLVLWAPFL